MAGSRVVECPLCSVSFHHKLIAAHASSCGGSSQGRKRPASSPPTTGLQSAAREARAAAEGESEAGGCASMPIDLSDDETTEEHSPEQQQTISVQKTRSTSICCPLCGASLPCLSDLERHCARCNGKTLTKPTKGATTGIRVNNWLKGAVPVTDSSLHHCTVVALQF